MIDTQYFNGYWHPQITFSLIKTGKGQFHLQIRTNQFQKEIKEHGNYNFPLLVSIEKLSKYESGSFLWHWHPEIELTLIEKGKMLYKVNTNSFFLHQGQALFGNSSTLHAGYMFQNQDCEYISITFDPKLIYGYDNSIVYTKYVKPIIQNFSLSAIPFDLSAEWHQDIIQIIKEIIQIESEKCMTYELDIISKLEKFWKLLFLNNDKSSIETPYDKKSYDRIRDIISYIEANYASSLTLEDISESIHICRSECSRLFKKYMQISLFDFVSQYRIEKSIQYLTSTNFSIIEIAGLVGFNDSNYYAKVFRKHKGCSPTQYRQSNKKFQNNFDAIEIIHIPNTCKNHH